MIKILRIALKNFRNYTLKIIDFAEGINHIHGQNGQGKTNLLEAINIITLGRSFRADKLTQCIQDGHNAFEITAWIEKDGLSHEISLHYTQDKKKLIIDDTSYQQLSKLIGLFPLVTYSPKDIGLISGLPSERRRFLNFVIAQSNPIYFYHLMRYTKALKQRNHLLKNKSESLLHVYELEMAKSAVSINSHRRQAVDELNHHLQKTMTYYLAPRPAETKVEYTASLKADDIDSAAMMYKKSRSKDMILKTTSLGPHRDDLRIFLNNQEAKLYASEGQKHMLALGLKLAECDSLEQHTDIKPIFCIDDYGSHLDSLRSERLRDQMSSHSQALITSPNHHDGYFGIKIDSNELHQVF